MTNEQMLTLLPQIYQNHLAAIGGEETRPLSGLHAKQLRMLELVLADCVACSDFLNNFGSSYSYKDITISGPVTDQESLAMDALYIAAEQPEEYLLPAVRSL